MNTRPLFSLHFIIAPALMLTLLLLTSCDKEAPPPSASMEESATPTNRIDINPAVRQNLGITFAIVESRAVTRTLRLPGRFELLPTAIREYRAIAPATVELLVEQYQTIKVGDPLYRLDSPRWRELQRELADAHADVTLARANVDSIPPLLEAHENHHTEIQKAVDLWTARIATLEQLESVGGVRGDEVAQARASLATSRVDLAETLEKEAELIARKAQYSASLQAATARLDFLFQAAASLTSLSPAQLQAPSASHPELPHWQTLSSIQVRANAPGIIDAIARTSGSVVDQNDHILTTIQPHQLRFRATSLQSDLSRLSNGQRAFVVPMNDAVQPSTSSTSPESPSSLAGLLTIAPTADAQRRTFELLLTPDIAASQDSANSSAQLPHWARAGVSAFLEVTTSGSASQELAIPLKCVARDGTAAIIFRRDPSDPNKAIRLEADLGMDDGRWIIINSGVAEGNEIVLDGVYQLMVATSGSITKGGHFHPDGTFHEGEH